MTKDEALKKIEELKRYVEQDETILVPDNIEIEEIEETGNLLGLKFGDEQSLYHVRKIWRVDDFNEDYKVQCKLTPCKREDLEAGDLVFGDDCQNPNFRVKPSYCIILDDKKYVSITDNKDCIVSSNNWKYWWKVEKV